jgi:hypothetical protein
VVFGLCYGFAEILFKSSKNDEIKDSTKMAIKAVTFVIAQYLFTF